jgi:hypothetical protein
VRRPGGPSGDRTRVKDLIGVRAFPEISARVFGLDIGRGEQIYFNVDEFRAR